MSQESEIKIQANCFGCKKDGNKVNKVDILNPERKVIKNGRLCLVGKCAVCGKNVSRFISDPEKPALTAEEKKANEKKRREEKKREREANPDLKAQPKKAKKRKIRIGDTEITIIASEVTDESVPKRRKLTAKEKREKEIKELKEKNEELDKHLKELLADLEAQEESGSEEEEEEKEEEEKDGNSTEEEKDE